MKPGDTVKFQLTFTGVVVKERNGYVTVRTKRGEQTIPTSDVLEVLEPEPDEEEVVKYVRCPGCLVVAGVPCRHKQSGSEIKHPHKERVELYVEVTGWTP